ncbi:helix-turn-helix transcriptional regulator [Mesorhizobium sp. M3A.F.Ca.ET.080.04.2.1]|uniref:helix-turn-helix domain-containing protein n=1 Tax=Mesorhizobium sp. M3A.F.Ca.ET.080.04.2.1 TaxID=2493676 RepID=UPI0032AF14E6
MDSRMPSGRAQDLTPKQSRQARALLKWTQVRLAAKPSMSEGTIRDFENGKRLLPPTRIEAIRHALESAGVVIAPESVSLRSQVAIQ